MRKGSSILFSLLTVLMLNFVSANVVASGIDKGLYQITQVMRVLAVFFLGDAPSSEYLLVKFLMFFIIFTVLLQVVKRMPNFNENNAVPFIIAFAISILSVRFMTPALTEFVWLPNSLLGIVIMAFLPFIIYFYFIESFNSTVIRKVGWTAFVILYTGLAYFRWDELQNINPDFNLGWIYLIVAVISGILLLFDRQIKRLFGMYGGTYGNADFWIQRDKIQDKLDKVELSLSKEPSKNQKKELEKERKRLKESLKNIDEIINNRR